MGEISERLDKRNWILGEMNVKLDTLDVINNKLDTLPERIAEVLRR